MKKVFAIVLALAMSLSLVACGGSNPAPAASSGSASSADAGSTAPTKLTLILRGGTYGDVIKAALPEFEKANNVQCEVLDLSFDDLHSKIALDAVNQKGAYDLCMVDGSWMAEFTANNVLTNLSELGYKFDDDIIPATTEICKVGEDIYLAPYFGNVTVMLYNKQLIADAGYTPEQILTFEDLMTIAQKANAAGKTGFLIRGGSPDNIVSDFIPHLLAHNGWVVDENNKPTVNTPEFKAAMEEYLALYKLGDTMDKDDIVAAIDNGDAALGQGWPGWYVPKADSNASYVVIPTKLNAADTAKNTSMYGVWTVGICNNSQNKEMTMKLLEYLMSPEVQLASVPMGGVPCRTSCLTDPAVLKDMPHMQTVADALQVGVYRPVIEQWNDFTTVLGTEMDNIIQGTKTIDVGLADAQKGLEALMG